MVLPAELVGVEVWSVSAEEVEVAALVASAERVDVAALFASAERVDAAVWALAWVLAQVLAVASVLPLPAVSLEAGVCLPHSQSGAQFLAEWGPLLDAGEVYLLAVDGADPHWVVALPLV